MKTILFIIQLITKVKYYGLVYETPTYNGIWRIFQEYGEDFLSVSDCEEIGFEWKLKGGMHGNANY